MTAKDQKLLLMVAAATAAAPIIAHLPSITTVDPKITDPNTQAENLECAAVIEIFYDYFRRGLEANTGVYVDPTTGSAAPAGGVAGGATAAAGVLAAVQKAVGALPAAGPVTPAGILAIVQAGLSALGGAAGTTTIPTP